MVLRLDETGEAIARGEHQVERRDAIRRIRASTRSRVRSWSGVRGGIRPECIVRRVTVVLYGATGYTGALVTDELVRRGAPFVLAGRNREKLERISAERGGGAPVAVASLDDPAALRALLEEARVVINCAGPFTLPGRPWCGPHSDTGTHYLDSTGEQPYIRMVFERLGAEAERRGVALVPAMGFDYLPGDCIARIAADGHEPLERLTLAYAVKGFGASRGTMRSGLEMMKGGDVVYEDGDWRPAPLGVFRKSFDFPPPIGEQGMARYPSGEVDHRPAPHQDAERDRSLITARTVAPAPGRAVCCRSCGRASP